MGGVVSIYTLHILSNNYLITPRYDLNKIIFVISILSYPIIDIIRIFFVRLYGGKSPFEADKNHIHHKILKHVKKHYLVVTIIIFLSIIMFYILQMVFR